MCSNKFVKKTIKNKPVPPESIGKRIAKFRYKNEWTQQGLASRLAISRVAISHIEMDLSIPSERTIALLAGIFKMSPYDLVNGTTYPQAKMDRLPELVCWYTPLELDLAILETDLEWLSRLENYKSRFIEEIWNKWTSKLTFWENKNVDKHQLEVITAAKENLSAACLFNKDN